MRICFDLDNSLCTGKPYTEARPFPGAIELLADLKSEGHTIIIYTARGMGRTGGSPAKAFKEIGAQTFEQLERWGFAYDEIYFGKPAADIYYDDKSLAIRNYSEVRNHIDRLCVSFACAGD